MKVLKVFVGCLNGWVTYGSCPECSKLVEKGFCYCPYCAINLDFSDAVEVEEVDELYLN